MALRLLVLMFLALTVSVGGEVLSIRAETTARSSTQIVTPDPEKLLIQGNEQLEANFLNEALVSTENALALYKDRKDRLGEGKALVLLGRIAFELDADRDRALVYAKQSLEVSQSVRDNALEGQSRKLLGQLFRSEKEYEKSLENSLKALEIAKELKDRSVEVKILLDLADYHYSKEEYEQASSYTQQALTLAKEIKDVRQEAQSLTYVAGLYRTSKEYDLSLDYYNQALAKIKISGDRASEANFLGYIANVYEDLKNTDKKLEYNRLALQVARESNNRRYEADRLIKIGAIYYDDLQDYPKGLDFFQQGLAVAKDNKYGSAQAFALRNLGNYHNYILKQYDKALEFYQQGLNIAREAKSRYWQSVILARMADVYNSQGNRPKAIAFYQESEKVDFITDKRNCASNDVASLAQTFRYFDENARAFETWQKAIAIEQGAKDKVCELKVLDNLSDAYLSLEQTKQALETYQKGVSVARELNDRKQEVAFLRGVGYTYYVKLKDYENGQKYYQQALDISKELGNRDFIMGCLFHLANIDKEQKRYETALAKYQQTLMLTRELKNFSREFEILAAMSEIYADTKAKQKSDEVFNQIIAIARKLRDPSLLTARANDKLLNAEPQKAARLLENAIAIAKEIGDKSKEGWALSALTNSYFIRGEYQKVFGLAKQGLEIAKQIDDRSLEGLNKFLIGGSYTQLGEPKQAIKYLSEALEIEREIQNRPLEGQVLAMLSIAYVGEQSSKALELGKQSLAIAQETKQRFFEGSSLFAIALAHQALLELRQSYETSQQLFAIAEEVKNPLFQVQALAMQSSIFSSFGDNRRALDASLKLLSISQQLQDRKEEAGQLADIAILYKSLGAPTKALEFAEKAVAVAKTSQDPDKESSTLRTLAYIYGSQGKIDRAIALIRESQSINEKIEKSESSETRLEKQERRQGRDRSILTLLGSLYHKAGKDREAKEYFEQALAIPLPKESSPDIGDGARLGLGRVYVALKQPKKAIPYYKTVIDNTEKVRTNIRQLSTDLQKSYLQDTGGLDNKKTEDTYREYADALLSLNRVSEAVQVLDLLKVREITTYLGGTRGLSDNVTPNAAPDTNQFDRKHYDDLLATAIKDAKELKDLKALPVALRSPEQKQRVEELSKRDEDLNAYFDRFVQSPEVKKTIAELNKNGQTFNLGSLASWNKILRGAPNTAFFYPLVLEDRIELILVTLDAPPIHRTVKINNEELREKIFQFRVLIRKHESEEIKTTARELYDLLIAPIDSDLKQANVKTILYAPDSVLRYIPLAALYDGKQWLIERYTNNIITATNVVSLAPSDYKQLTVLAGAFPAQDVSSGNRSEPFKGLAFAESEVNKIAAKVPNTTKLIGADFQRAATKSHMSESNYKVVHLATHGKFVGNDPRNSFIVFGDGEILTIRDINSGKLPLRDINLFVLSACETAIGTIKENSTGEEILGMGFQITNNGAQAAIATLWTIDDGGTEALMERFYTYLPQGKFSPLDALQQSQIDMIGSPRSGKHNFSHPYYWAPFILIGNGF